MDAEPEPQTPDGARKMNVRDDLEAIAEACRILGCKHCRTFSAGTDDFATEENVRKYAKKMDEAAERPATVGLDYSYHPHNIEFTKFGGKTAMHIMKEEAKTLKFEMCPYWIQAGGLDSERLTREFGATAELLSMHLKDFRVPPIDKAEWLEIWKLWIRISCAHVFSLRKPEKEIWISLVLFLPVMMSERNTFSWSRICITEEAREKFL